MDEALGQLEGERRDLVDDDEGVANDSSLDGGGTAGDDGGSGMVEGFAGIGDEVEVSEQRWGIALELRKPRFGQLSYPRRVERGGNRKKKLAFVAEKGASFKRCRKVCMNLFFAAAGK